MAYKQFGIPSQRSLAEIGTAGEYNFNSSTFQPRFNDCYIHCPEFGTDPENKIIWTPGAYRVNTANPSKITNLTLSFEESALNPQPYSALRAAGLTMYYKVGGDASNNFRIRDIPVPIFNPLSGTTLDSFLAAGSTGDPNAGSTFSWSLKRELCIGFPMGVTLASPNDYKGIYTFYIVNRNASNDSEIAWRVQYLIGMEYQDSTGCPLGICPENLPPGSGGITLPANVYVISNPATDVDPTDTIAITIGAEEKTIAIGGNTADNYAIYYSLSLNEPTRDV